ncbi:uncharacterized protein BO80DRAFT_465721 [Aspergillus ibericus CBS 121593]|uniref:Uncharacterized protein n=1 Tax=Aspergillus ibericus CBS 121593 TaxID=1448316 RepID=A0A395GZA5_9EURO|nr:hypothetical protein BO80DRAFT_465721 [Aspergillus ibericus CBS 121593]RAL00008.1 hypothetical protein BO80DRAFT_465721 [Aspergillus ibericus CBS 121593]
MSILDSVPDLIREKALQAGIKDTVAPKKSNFCSYSDDIKNAFKDGDYNYLSKNRDTVATDLNPVYGNFQQNGDQAFFTVTNPSNNTDYQLSIAGPTTAPYAYMWVYTDPSRIDAARRGQNDAGPGDHTLQPVVQYGTLSMNGSTLGIQNSILEEKWFELGAAVISLAFGKVIGKAIFNRIEQGASAAFADIISAAVDATGLELAEAGVISTALWDGIASLAVTMSIELAAGVAIYFLILFIANIVYREYKIVFNIRNWDPDNDYIIDTSPAGYNEQLDGNQDWEETIIPRPSHTVTMPDGITVISKESICMYSSYIYVNSVKVFAGVGVAVVVKNAADKSKGFGAKYLCPYLAGNSLGLTGGVVGSPLDYYNDDSTWAPGGSYKAESSTPDGIPLSCTTDSLSGAQDEVYTFDVNIGLEPSSKFKEPRPEPPKSRPLLPQPEVPTRPSVGDAIRLPNGDSVKVLR